MKNIVKICAAASLFFAACNSNPASDLDTKKDVVLTDTSKMYNSNGSTDTATTTQINVAPPKQNLTSPPPPQTQTVKVVTRTVYVNKVVHNPEPVSHPVQQPAPPVVVPPVTTPSTTTSSSQTTTTTTTQGSGSTGTGNGNGTIPSSGGIGKSTPTSYPAAKDKGWSTAAKDATIGAVGGAIGGAIISRKKGKGAVIGGVLGAAGGYILGRKKDKENAQNQDQ